MIIVAIKIESFNPSQILTKKEMSNPSEKEMTVFSKKLNRLWREQKMTEAKEILFVRSREVSR